MCEDKAHGGRRCPGDTSAARVKRARNARVRAAHAGHVAHIPTVGPHATVEAVDSYATLESLTADVRRDMACDWNSMGSGEMDRRVCALGEKVHQIAVILNGGHDVSVEDAGQGGEIDRLKSMASIVIKNINRNVPAYLTDYESWYSEELDGDMKDMFESAGCDREDSRKDVVRKLRDFARARHYSVADEYARLYRRALEHVGVAFGGDISAHEKSAKKSLDALAGASQYIPSAWINSSNAHHHRLHVRNTEGRGAHVTRVIENGRYATTAPGLYGQNPVSSMYPNPMSPDRAEAVYDGWDEHDRYTEFPVSAGDIDGDGFYTTYWGQRYDMHAVIPHLPKNGDAIFINSENDIAYIGEGRRPPKGWAKIEGDPGWVFQPAGGLAREVVGEIRIHGEGKDAERVAIHEFTHRTEETTPTLKLMEKAFLQRRISPGEQLTQVGTSKRDIGYADSFHSAYSGRIYSDGSREVMSVGMERMFYGSYGGFGGKVRDDDYRNFVLGAIVATSANQ